MANSDSSPPLPQAAPLSLRKENITPVGSKIAELNESRAELLNRIQGLKQDLQSWRSKLDTQVKVYRDNENWSIEMLAWFANIKVELSDLKKSLNVEVDQLRSEFQELRTTLQQQQEDVSSSLRNLGDVSSDAKEAQAQDPKVEEDDKEGLVLHKEELDETSEN
uniref:Uncharacterized protein n=1 Tax=Fagus sylvatica TaxID=28930 RepID=A0A2N9IC75_FAGSY